MTHTVCEPCNDCKYTDCVAVCPVECFYQDDMLLYIDPVDCIDCEACVPECPVEAIFAEANVPAQWANYTPMNAERSAALKAAGEGHITEKQDAKEGPGVQEERLTSSSPGPRANARGLGVLIIQLGTPDAPTADALRPYLRQFLGDPRVIENPPWYWPFIFRLILLRRPASSAAKYQRIWNAATGSPLLHWTKRQTELLQAKFPNIPVRFGMQVGNPPLAGVVDDMIRAGTDRLIVLPMYPQYSATTTASATDALFKSLLEQRRVPALRIVPPYYQHPAYLDAMTALISEELRKLPWKPDHCVLSFHGIPVRYAQAGDPYATHVKRTTQALIARLGWQRGDWTQSFQSLFGRERWLKPYTDDVLQSLARQGKKKVFIAMPGFTADCLETVDEIGHESLEVFRHAGGKQLHACPCLNDHPAWIEAMHTIIREEGQGWW